MEESLNDMIHAVTLKPVSPNIGHKDTEIEENGIATSSCSSGADSSDVNETHDIAYSPDNNDQLSSYNHDSPEFNGVKITPEPTDEDPTIITSSLKPSEVAKKKTKKMKHKEVDPAKERNKEVKEDISDFTINANSVEEILGRVLNNDPELTEVSMERNIVNYKLVYIFDLAVVLYRKNSLVHTIKLTDMLHFQLHENS